METGKRVYRFLSCYFNNEFLIHSHDMLDPYTFQLRTYVFIKGTRVFSFEKSGFGYNEKIDNKFLGLVSDITGVEYDELKPIILCWVWELYRKKEDNIIEKQFGYLM